MHYQVNAIFAVHSSRGLVFGSTLWVDFDEICFDVDAELLSTEVVEWRMELTGLPDTVMGTLKAERRRVTETGAKPSRGDLPVYVARILTMSDRDRELYRSWLEDRSESRSPKRDASIKSLLSKSKGPRSVAPEPNVSRAPEPKADPQADPSMKTHGTDSTSERYGLNDRSSRQRSSLGRQAIRDALRASLRGGPASKDETARKESDWLENAGRGRNPSFLDERPAARRKKPDDDATKPPEYDFPALDEVNDTAHAMGFRERAKPAEAAAPPHEPPPERTPTPTIPSVPPPADLKVARDLHVVHRAPAITTRATRPTPPTQPPSDTTPSLDEFIRAPLPPPPTPKPPVRPDADATPDLPGRTVVVLPRSRPPQVTVHYRDKALFRADYEKHLRGGGIVIQLPDLDTTGMRAFIRLVLPSGKDVRCRAEVVTLMPEGAGVQLQLRPEDKELLRVEAER